MDPDEVGDVRAWLRCLQGMSWGEEGQESVIKLPLPASQCPQLPSVTTSVLTLNGAWELGLSNRDEPPHALPL